ncbi:MAG: phosphatidate cytidylyltransferase [Roseibacillus sp.]|nr:phosphatidate cytidylyltransferase [Roseibacillus sp.]
MVSATSNGSSRAASFRARLLSTILLWGFVAFVFSSGKLWLMGVMVGLFTLIGSLEFLVLTREAPGRECRNWGFVVCAGFLLHTIFQALGSESSFGSHNFLPEVAGVLLVTLGSFCLRLRFPIEGDASVQAVSLALLGFVYVPVLFGGFIIRLALYPAEVTSGFWLILLVVVVAKFTDMGAYLVGTLIGRHKAIPHISPAKSWEGYIGALFFAGGGAFAVHALSREHLSWLAWPHVLGLGLVVAIAAMVGDLAESILKRSLQVKDSGQILPGIGGILDLIDSLCFALPAAFFYLYLQSL